MFYMVFDMVIDGASHSSVEEWVAVIAQKQAHPESLSVAKMIEIGGQIFNHELSLSERVEGIFNNYSKWLSSHSNALHVLRYEDFIAGRLEKLEKYLGFPLVGQCDVPEKRVRRSAGSGSWRHLMLPSDIELLQASCKDALAAYGYDDWTLASEPHLDPAHGTDYVRRIADEAFKEREEREQLLLASAAPREQPVWKPQFRFY